MKEYATWKDAKKAVHNGKAESGTLQLEYLNRLFMNLAGNAVKYNRRGGKVILYFNEISSDDKTAVFEFVCSDTGLGMSEEFQKHAFESYAREGKETTNGYSGARLGLSIVKDIVDRMISGSA